MLSYDRIYELEDAVKMKSSCVCGLCDLSISKGTRVFAAIEMFLVLMHLKHIYDAGADVIIATELGLSENFYIYHFFKGTWCVCLILQSVFAFLLYFVGCKQKNITVCSIWIGIAACTWINCAILVIILLIRKGPPIPRSHSSHGHAQLEEFVCGGRRHLFVAVYEAYLLYGIWLVYKYIKWVQNEGIIGEVIENIVDTLTLAKEQNMSELGKDADPEIANPLAKVEQELGINIP